MNMLKQLIGKLICCHKWQLLQEVPEHLFYCEKTKTEATPISVTYIYTCEKCGKIKQFKIKTLNSNGY